MAKSWETGTFAPRGSGGAGGTPGPTHRRERCVGRALVAGRPVVPAVPLPARAHGPLGDRGGRAVQDSSMVLVSWQADANPGFPGRSVERNSPNATSVADKLPVLQCDPL